MIWVVFYNRIYSKVVKFFLLRNICFKIIFYNLLILKIKVCLLGFKIMSILNLVMIKL